MLNQPSLFGTDEACLLDRPLAVIDLETTGTGPTRDRVIEIGLILVRGGEEEERWSTLVNPQRRLSPFIEGYTGITTAMLQDAPTFAEIAGSLRQRLANRLLVAHNVRFDYGFLQAEYARLDQSLACPTLCTVRLSRQLYPQERRHNLDNIISRHRIACVSRHRALDDALALADFLRCLRAEQPVALLDKAVRKQLKPF
ncbi:DNA polymerase III epsilon subunit family exonuclease [Geothermobacter ehrlichii]|uniref:DNA polymerase III epsilon subunit family exonuclease n=1 Tax=Geothermobacter ehrlichii TaxID=213224 RepID=A0A5D3WK24_9BACT|nr:3'-5' exonuclease [Geothermobacter ehrlichii]TYO99325.1 DNA polymerase III epsilon subunit family exonuclease [Geothermobacter ehrlichii]